MAEELNMLGNIGYAWKPHKTTIEQLIQESLPILAPTALKELPDLTLAVGVTESVDLVGLFSGLNLSISAVSSNTDKATVQVNSSRTSMGVVGVAAGSATITVSGSNQAGTTDVSFVVTVTEGA